MATVQEVLDQLRGEADRRDAALVDLTFQKVGKLVRGDGKDYTGEPSGLFDSGGTQLTLLQAGARLVAAIKQARRADAEADALAAAIKRIQEW